MATDAKTLLLWQRRVKMKTLACVLAWRKHRFKAPSDNLRAVEKHGRSLDPSKKVSRHTLHQERAAGPHLQLICKAWCWPYIRQVTDVCLFIL